MNSTQLAQLLAILASLESTVVSSEKKFNKDVQYVTAFFNDWSSAVKKEILLSSSTATASTDDTTGYTNMTNVGALLDAAHTLLVMGLSDIVSLRSKIKWYNPFSWGSDPDPLKDFRLQADKIATLLNFTEYKKLRNL